MVTPPHPKQAIPSIAKKQKPEIMIQPQVISQTEYVPYAQNSHRQPLRPKLVTRQAPSCQDLYPKPPPKASGFKRKEEELNGFGYGQ